MVPPFWVFGVKLYTLNVFICEAPDSFDMHNTHTMCCALWDLLMKMCFIVYGCFQTPPLHLDTLDSSWNPNMVPESSSTRSKTLTWGFSALRLCDAFWTYDWLKAWNIFSRDLWEWDLDLICQTWLLSDNWWVQDSIHTWFSALERKWKATDMMLVPRFKISTRSLFKEAA